MTTTTYTIYYSIAITYTTQSTTIAQTEIWLTVRYCETSEHLSRTFTPLHTDGRTQYTSCNVVVRPTCALQFHINMHNLRNRPCRLDASLTNNNYNHYVYHSRNFNCYQLLHKNKLQATLSPLFGVLAWLRITATNYQSVSTKHYSHMVLRRLT